MRGVGFALALAALCGAVVNCWTRSRPLLAQRAQLHREVDSALDDGIARARSLGAPPSAEEVRVIEGLARTAEQARAQFALKWWNGARDCADYLYPCAARPRPKDADVRARLDELLLQLPADSKAIVGLSTARLGLLPSNNRPSNPNWYSLHQNSRYNEY